LIKKELMIKKGMLGFFVIYGIIGAAVSLMQYVGLAFGISVAIVSMLLYTQPVWTIIFGKFMLKEKITKKKVLAVIVAMTGILALLSPWQAESMPNIKGVLSALLAGIFLSLWFIFGRKSGISKNHYLTTTFGSIFFSSIWLLIANPFINLFFHDPMFRLSFEWSPTLPLLFMFGFVTLVIGCALFYKGMEKVEASKAGIIALFEPVSATILAAIFFSQPITLPIIIGGALILASNYIVTS